MTSEDFIQASIRLAKAVREERDFYALMGCDCPKDDIQTALEDWEATFESLKREIRR